MCVMGKQSVERKNANDPKHTTSPVKHGGGGCHGNGHA